MIRDAKEKRRKITHQHNMLLRPLFPITLTVFGINMWELLSGNVSVITCLFAFSLISVRRSEKSSSIHSIYLSWALHYNTIPAIILSLYSHFIDCVFFLVHSVSSRCLILHLKCYCELIKMCVCVCVCVCPKLMMEFHLSFGREELSADRLRGKNPIIMLTTK